MKTQAEPASFLNEEDGMTLQEVCENFHLDEPLMIELVRRGVFSAEKMSATPRSPVFCMSPGSRRSASRHISKRRTAERANAFFCAVCAVKRSSGRMPNSGAWINLTAFFANWRTLSRNEGNR